MEKNLGFQKYRDTWRDVDETIVFVSWPFPSSQNSLFQNEAKCKTFLVKMSFICMRMKNHFHINDLALNLTLLQRLSNSRMTYWLTNDFVNWQANFFCIRRRSWLTIMLLTWEGIPNYVPYLPTFFSFCFSENLMTSPASPPSFLALFPRLRRLHPHLHVHLQALRGHPLRLSGCFMP